MYKVITLQGSLENDELINKLSKNDSEDDNMLVANLIDLEEKFPGKKIIMSFLLLTFTVPAYGSDSLDEFTRQVSSMHVTERKERVSEDVDVQKLRIFFSAVKLFPNNYVRRVKLHESSILAYFNKVTTMLEQSHKVNLIPLKSARSLENKISIIKELPPNIFFKLEEDIVITFRLREFLSDYWGVKEEN